MMCDLQPQPPTTASKQQRQGSSPFTLLRSVATLAFLALAPGCKVAPDPFSDPSIPCPSAPELAIPAPPVFVPTSRQTPGEERPAYSGHPMALAGTSLLIVDDINGTLVRMDAQTLQVQATIPLGNRPYHVVTDGTHAWVTVRDPGHVAKVSLQDGTVETFAVGAEPTGLALSPDGQSLLVALAGTSELVSLRASDFAELDRAQIDHRPTAVAISSELHVAVVHQNSPMATFELDTQGGLRKQGKAALNRDFATGEPVFATRAVSAAPDPETGGVAAVHVTVRPGAEAVSVAATLASLEGADAESCNVTHAAAGGYGSGSGGSTFAIPKRAPATVAISAPASFSSDLFEFGQSVTSQDPAEAIDQPADIAFHPTLKLAAVVGTGTDNLVFLDTFHATVSAVAHFSDFSAPRAVVLAPTGELAWVLLGNDLAVAVVDLLPLQTNDSFQQAPTELHVAAVSSPYAVDPSPDGVQKGRRLFFNATNPRVSARSHFACATCHVEGADDQQVWFVTDGPRQTPILANRVENTGPFNWKGSQAVLQNNMVDTVHRMGGQGLRADELAALEQFIVHGLHGPANPNLSPQGLTKQQKRGQMLFEDAQVGCAGCHTPGLGTDGRQHDVGTSTSTDEETALIRGDPEKGGRFNTPSLVGLWRSAPYFHDGSAETLGDVLRLTSNVGKMGDTSTLTIDDRLALIAYLLTL